jgi:hypothetical protein
MTAPGAVPHHHQELLFAPVVHAGIGALPFAAVA